MCFGECSGGVSGLRTVGEGSYSSSPISDPIVNFSSLQSELSVPSRGWRVDKRIQHRRLLGNRDFPEYSN